MELDDMKLAWQALDRRLARQQAIHLQLYRDGRLDQLRRRLRPLALGLALQIPLGVALMLWGIGFWSTHLGAMLRTTRTPPTEHMRAEDLRELQAVSRRFGITALNYRSALARGLNGDAEGAVQELAVIRGLYGARSYRAILRDWADDGRRYPAIAAIQPPPPAAP